MRTVGCLVLALCLLGAQAKKGSEAEFLSSLRLSTDNMKDAFDGLDVKTDGKVDMEDLKVHYYYVESAFARKKFVSTLNTDADKDSICKEELDTFLQKDHITAAVWECTYIKSESLREYCFADQLINYVYLVLDTAAMDAFFKSLDCDGNGVIKIDEVQKLKTNKFNDKEVANFMREIGGDDGEISKEEFFLYISHEDLLDDFRACRTKLVGFNGEYNNDCLKAELTDWTANHLTEKDVIATFDLFEDDSDDDLDITVEDIKKVSGCDDTLAQKFVYLMDKTGDGKVCYAEFRTYVRSHLVRVRLEKDCAAKIVDQAKEVECYKDDLIKRVNDMFTPMWFRTPDMDMVFHFEHLDYTNNGKISAKEDLMKGYQWTETAAAKFISEMDGPDDDTDVSLDEFNDYVHWPHIAYGLGDCLGNGRCDDRVICFAAEIKDIFSVMMDKAKVDAFFKFYDKDNNGVITKTEVQARGVQPGEDLENFMNEMGMGDQTIGWDEFAWYARQQEVSHIFVVTACKNHEELHKQLLLFTQEKFTQYDGQELYKALDTNGDFELTVEEFGGASPDVVALMQKMDGSDRDKTANFLEYWVFLHTPIGNPRKIKLEINCTKPKKTQAEEIECYKSEIKKLGKD